MDSFFFYLQSWSPYDVSGSMRVKIPYANYYYDLHEQLDMSLYLVHHSPIKELGQIISYYQPLNVKYGVYTKKVQSDLFHTSVFFACK